MSEKTEVLYNGACPACRREMHHYARLSADAALPIVYCDLGDAAELERWGITSDTAARRLHLRKDGQVYAGIPAFVVLWQQIPSYSWLARFVSLPGIHWVASALYDHALAPILYRRHLRRRAKR